jgi:hypothetical protein
MDFLSVGLNHTSSCVAALPRKWNRSARSKEEEEGPDWATQERRSENQLNASIPALSLLN